MLFSQFPDGGTTELFESRVSIVRAVIRNWFATSCRTSGRRAERTCRVYCEPKRSRAKIAPDKKREKEQTGDGGSYILRSFVRSFVHPPIRPFIRSYRYFLFLATPYCQVAYTRRLLSVSSWRTRVRDATYPRVRTRVRRRRHVTSVATFACVFRFGTRCNIAAGRRKNDVAYVLLAAARCGHRRVILKICLAPGNTSRVVIDTDIVGLKNASRDVFYADSTSR